jgi:nitroreductase
VSFLELVKKRYSVRSFLEKPVEDEKLRTVLEAARWAPSACNNQPLLFIVIREEQARKNLETVYNRSWFLNAPVIIAACCDHRISWRRSDGKDFGDIDVAIALDHLTLAATDIGLGTCWIGAFKPSEAKKVLLLPEEVEPVAFTPLGYASPNYASSNYANKSRKQIEEFVYWDFFGKK